MSLGILNFELVNFGEESMNGSDLNQPKSSLINR